MGQSNEPVQDIYNCHSHVFTSRHVPDGFLPLGLLPKLRGSPVAGVIRRLSESLYWLPYVPRVGRLFAFLGIGDLASSYAIFNELRGYYPTNTRFVLLSLDMDFMGAGSAPEPYEAQLAVLRKLKAQEPDTVLPFVCADPRRPGVVDLVIEHIEEHGFSGIKLYPPLGFYPFDARLDEIYDYAETCGIPLIAHCSRGGIYQHNLRDSDVSPHPCNRDLTFRGQRPAKLAEHLTNPRNYAPILERFPKLKLCLAHFGGADEWSKYLGDAWYRDRPRAMESREMPNWFTPEAWFGDESWLSVVMNLMHAYPNVYADSSYTSVLPWSHPLLKVLTNTPELRTKILFGTDFYMVRMAATERLYSINVRGYLGESDFMQIAHHNPLVFLQHTRPVSAASS